MNTKPQPPLIVWWIIWASFQTGIFVFYQFLGGPQKPEAAADPRSVLWLAALMPVVLSVVVRWLVLPRAVIPQLALPLFIVGIALAEATCFFGLFIFPEHKQALVLTSALGIFQFIPLFARRFYP